MNIQDPAVWGLVALAATFGFIVGRFSKPSPNLKRELEQQLIQQMLKARNNLTGEQLQSELLEILKAFQKLCP